MNLQTIIDNLSYTFGIHRNANTNVHGVTSVAGKSDIAVDLNLSAAAQDAISKKHVRSHSITSTNDHTGPTPSGQFLRDDLSWQTIASGGDMAKATYDTNNNGIVDKAEAIDDNSGHTASATNLQTAVTDMHTHTNKTILDAIEVAFTSALKSGYDWCVSNLTSAWKSSVDGAVSASHGRQHAINATADHTSSITWGKWLRRT